MWDYATVITQLCLFISVLIATLLLVRGMRTKPRKLAKKKAHPPKTPQKTMTRMPLASVRTAPTSPEESNYIFFWKVDEPYGYLSQWYHSPFTARIHLPGEAEARTDLLTFLTAEHYMMASKALLFNDHTVFDKVLACGSTNTDMIAVKALGREVHDFSDEVWERSREEIVYNGSLAKFGHEENKELKEKLLATGVNGIAEASPRDRVWGIGFGEKRALEVQANWGLNLLGIALMKTREKLRE